MELNVCKLYIKGLKFKMYVNNSYNSIGKRKEGKKGERGRELKVSSRFLGCLQSH